MLTGKERRALARIEEGLAREDPDLDAALAGRGRQVVGPDEALLTLWLGAGFALFPVQMSARWVSVMVSLSVVVLGVLVIIALGQTAP
ncbi:DUF3040 domain-containing protein [Nonomuraea sp. NPDC050790]|uniref:DUF3040 domain-containing protein n=1 Tax=Nonomuraea sp. NPDC050790 TaxID=3364371 RepID=UPI0037A1B0C6